jgi:hypothetical protein
MICHFDMINSLFCTVLTQAEINWFVAYLFDKDLPTARPDSVPDTFCSENPPPSVSITISFGILYTCG